MDEVILELLKLNLQITSGAYDAFLSHLIEAAKTEIAREGITLSLSDAADLNLVVMYAAYLYRKREGDTAMPRMLRYALNNRLFAEKVGG